MARIVQQGAGNKANLHLTVLPSVPESPVIINRAKGRTELRTSIGQLYFYDEHAATVAAYLAGLASAITAAIVPLGPSEEDGT